MAINKTGSDCSGCTACQAVCPKGCISMEPDALGFKYPKVDYSKCIECGLCERTCPFTPGEIKELAPKAYAARNSNEDELLGSSSGAIFVSISDYVLNNGGVVYGVGFGAGLHVEHKRATDRSERDELRGSKYVQSDLKQTIKEIVNDLRDGRFVLFTGTPCQNAGVLAAVPTRLRERLLCVDIICHGCPSPQVWDDYVKWFSRKHGLKGLRYAKFRDKRTVGWKAYTEVFSDGRHTIKGGDYIALFKKDVMLRESCGVCPYSSLDRPSDLTIGDFWGYENYKPSLNPDGRGVSIILVNSDKGAQFFNDFKDTITCEEVPLDVCMQRNLRRSTPLNSNSEVFASDFASKGLVYVMKRYGEYGIVNKCKMLARRVEKKLQRIFS